MSSVIETQDVHFRFSSGEGLFGVTLTVEPGRTFAVLGRNGSGKTTLNRVILGILRPRSGRVSVFDQQVSAGDRRHLHRIGTVLDKNVHWENLSGFANAYFTARTHGLSDSEARERLDRLFQEADLQDRAGDPVADYSFGMRRKLSIIQAFCHEPDLLIMDEPTVGIDPQFTVTLAEWLRQHRRSGRTTWMVGNDPGWFAETADQTVFMDHGRIVYQGEMVEALSLVSELREVRIVMNNHIPVTPPDWDYVRSFDQDGNILTVLISDSGRRLPAVMEYVVSSGGEVRSVEMTGGGLDDAFLLKTGKTVNG